MVCDYCVWVGVGIVENVFASVIVFSVGAACWVASDPIASSIVASMARVLYRNVPVTSCMIFLSAGAWSWEFSSAAAYFSLCPYVILVWG